MEFSPQDGLRKISRYHTGIGNLNMTLPGDTELNRHNFASAKKRVEGQLRELDVNCQDTRCVQQSGFEDA